MRQWQEVIWAEAGTRVTRRNRPTCVDSARNKAQIPLYRLPRDVRDKPVTSRLVQIPLRRLPRNFPVGEVGVMESGLKRTRWDVVVRLQQQIESGKVRWQYSLPVRLVSSFMIITCLGLLPPRFLVLAEPEIRFQYVPSWACCWCAVWINCFWNLIL